MKQLAKVVPKLIELIIEDAFRLSNNSSIAQTAT